MSRFCTARFMALGVACAGLTGLVGAQTFQTLGDGSAVSTIDRSASFNALAVNGTPLSDYSEGGLFICVDGDSWVGDGYPVPFDPFHGANGADHAFYCPYGGSQGWTTIETVDSKPIYALEFMYGNGWTTGDIYGPYPWGNHNAVVTWQSWRGGTMVSSGLIGDGPLLEMGTVVGFSDSVGFDQLLVKCTIASSGDPTLQVLALDNLHVQIQRPCTGDLDGDRSVGLSDLAILLSHFGMLSGAMPADGDLNGDQMVDIGDLAQLLSAFGSTCP